jgi:hypothetical protein
MFSMVVGVTENVINICYTHIKGMHGDAWGCLYFSIVELD